MSNEYPEHAKLLTRQEEHRHIVSFLNHLEERGIEVVKFDENMHPIAQGGASLVAEYFDVDVEKFDAEKRAILEALNG